MEAVRPEGAPMLCWTLLFFFFALIAGIIGFAGVVSVSVGIAKMLFFVFLLMVAATFCAYLVRD
ncbi:DUF1328 domain-containing protein [Geminicoccus roseus]|uniref:DUF1328 domain-containing protein n=1 Tax=Geminicoccus roseus TaxID=404900 RepID=UPI003899240B